jgi:hypothetical protein
MRPSAASGPRGPESTGGARSVRRPSGLHRLLVSALLLGSLVVGVQAASAHPWAQWHWNRSGSAIYLYTQNTAALYSQTNAARLDIQARPHPIYLPAVSYHTNISIMDCYCGNTGWSGLAQMINYSYPIVTHAHATYNRSYGLPVQGIMCQEIAHTFGLDHAATGDCMGLSYFASSNGKNYFGADSNPSGYSHPTQDLNKMYLNGYHP